MSWVFSAFADEAGAAIDQQARALLDAGLAHADLRSVGDHNIADLPEADAKRARATLDKAGIRVNMFGSPIGKIDIADDFAIDLRRLDHLALMADVFQCRAVRLFSYYNKKRRPEAEFASVVLDRLAQLRDKARKLGLKLYHENEHGIFGDTGRRVTQLADAVYDGDVFDLIFDFDNYVRCGDDCWDNWVKLRGRTGAFHFKDSTAPPDAVHVPLGEGAGQARKVLADAAERGWSGPCSLEPHLKHSKAVMATNVSGEQPQAYSQMTAPECFAVAADAAQRLLRELGIAYR